MIGDSIRLRREDIKIIPYAQDSLKGHAAWLDWPWKLHRIQDKSGAIQWELYQLENDSQEEVDLVAAEPERVAKMKLALNKWQQSVMHSMNGEDY